MPQERTLFLLLSFSIIERNIINEIPDPHCHIVIVAKNSDTAELLLFKKTSGKDLLGSIKKQHSIFSPYL